MQFSAILVSLFAVAVLAADQYNVLNQDSYIVVRKEEGRLSHNYYHAMKGKFTESRNNAVLILPIAATLDNFDKKIMAAYCMASAGVLSIENALKAVGKFHPEYEYVSGEDVFRQFFGIEQIGDKPTPEISKIIVSDEDVYKLREVLAQGLEGEDLVSVLSEALIWGKQEEVATMLQDFGAQNELIPWTRERLHTWQKMTAEDLDKLTGSQLAVVALAWIRKEVPQPLQPYLFLGFMCGALPLNVIAKGEMYISKMKLNILLDSLMREQESLPMWRLTVTAFGLHYYEIDHLVTETTTNRDLLEKIKAYYKQR